MHHLRLITDPRRPWEKYVAFQNVEQCKKKGLGSWGNNDLV
jgi:hypothetical protein